MLVLAILSLVLSLFYSVNISHFYRYSFSFVNHDLFNIIVSAIRDVQIKHYSIIVILIFVKLIENSFLIIREVGSRNYLIQLRLSQR